MTFCFSSKKMDMAFNFMDNTRNVTPGDIEVNYKAASKRYLE